VILGVLVSSDLYTSVYTDSIVANAHQRANAILRCFVSRDPQLLTRAYTVYMFGQYSNMIVLHGLPIWNRTLKNREGPKAIYKKLRGLEGLSYGERLRRLQLCIYFKTATVTLWPI